MPLHNRRRRLAQLTEREAAGESFWVDKFSERVRTRLLHLFQGSTGYSGVFAEHARMLILQDEGWRTLTNSSDRSTDFLKYLATCPDDMMPTVIEAIYEALRDANLRSRYGDVSSVWLEGTNEILAEERVSWEFVGSEMTPFSSREMHVEVVEPVLRLLT